MAEESFHVGFKSCKLLSCILCAVVKTENIHTEWSYSEFWKGVKNRTVSDTVLQKFKWKKYSSYFCVYRNPKFDDKISLYVFFAARISWWPLIFRSRDRDNLRMMSGDLLGWNCIISWISKPAETLSQTRHIIAA